MDGAGFEERGRAKGRMPGVKKSNQKKEHPAWRCLGCAQPVREERPGFSTGLLPGRKVPDVLSGTPVGPDRPPLTAAQGI